VDPRRPARQLERLVLAVERRLAREIAARPRSPWGEDITVMGVRTGSDVDLTISCALIGGHLCDLQAYLRETARVADVAREAAQDFGFEGCRIAVNAADDPDAGQVYLTVTGTSAEAGDDGQVGRGNRINGLITPGRPMSLEAAVGKNPVSHVGKIYNIAARAIAEEVVATCSEVRRAECLLVSRIGAPIDRPALTEVRVETSGACGAEQLSPQIGEIVASVLSGLTQRLDALASTGAPIY